MTNTSGLAADGQTEAVETVISGGADLALLPEGHTVAFTDSVADVEAAAAAIETVPEGDWSFAAGSGFDDTGVLSLAADVEFGPLDEGVLVQFAVLGDVAWALGKEIVDENSGEAPDTTGEDVTIGSGQAVYEVGDL